MRNNESNPQGADQLGHYFKDATLPSQQETLGSIVTEILQSNSQLSRKAICTRLLVRMEQTSCTREQHHYQQLIGLLFGRTAEEGTPGGE